MQRLIVGTSGHIDHGKSALVRALTGTDPDRLPEEKARGITIDLGFAHAEWDGIVFSFVDVPGHERFVRTMVAGATGIDVALLVVASDDAVMPQTREHLAILSLLGVRSGVVVRTKSDLVDEETGGLVDDEVRALVRGTFLEEAPVVAVSSLTGAGLPELRDALAEAARRLPERDPDAGVTRLFVDRVFTIKGFGPVVTGTMDGGRVRAEDRLTLWPTGREVRVRRVEVHGRARPEALSGERTSLNLAGVDREELERGQVLVAPGALAPSRVLTAEVRLLSSAASPLAHGMRVRVHHGTSDVGARVSFVTPAGSAAPVRSLAPGGSALVQLACETPVAALRGDPFILRRPSPVETLGGGRVLDTGRPRLTKRTSPRPEILTLLTGGDDDAVAVLFLTEEGARGLDSASLSRRLGVPPVRGAAIADRLVRDGRALRLSGGLLFSSEVSAQMAERAASIFAAHRKTGAPSPFLPRSEFLERFGRGISPQAQDGWLALLSSAGRLTVAADRIGPPGAHGEQVAEAASGFVDRVEAAYRKGIFDAPKGFELAKSIGTKPQVVEGLVGHLLKAGVLVRLSPDLVVHRDTVAVAEAKLATVRGQTLGVGAFRDLLGLTRKNLIPLLEYFDRVRKTRRAGDVRDVL
jgi:selenocysteine-specific elongation factor